MQEQGLVCTRLFVAHELCVTRLSQECLPFTFSLGLNSLVQNQLLKCTTRTGDDMSGGCVEPKESCQCYQPSLDKKENLEQFMEATADNVFVCCLCAAGR